MVLRQDRSRRDLRQPSARRDDRCMARLPALRRLERLRRQRKERRRPVLRPALHARANPHADPTGKDLAEWKESDVKEIREAGGEDIALKEEDGSPQINFVSPFP